MGINILIIEDDRLMCRSLNALFSEKGHHVSIAETAQEAGEIYKKKKFDLVFLDLRLPDGNGLDLFKKFREIDDDPAIIIITAYPEVKTAVSVIKDGAFDYIIKPFELDELEIVAEKALESRNLKFEVLRLRHQSKKGAKIPDILGESPAIQRLKSLISKIAQASKAPVLIQGESGVGKELVADAIHYSSNRADKPFVKVNCSAIPEGLLESELFGYEKGAFTEARQSKVGLFELADGGSIFLDEIGEMSLSLQPKLLRVLDGQPFKRLGGIRDIKVDVRVIAATNKNLSLLVKKGTLREDLYFRLGVIIIDVPPLRERREDILILAERFIKDTSKDLRKDIKGISDDAKRFLLDYPWPGNVRELKNVLERAIILASSNIICPEDLPNQLLERYNVKRSVVLGPSSFLDNEFSLEELEKQHILSVLEHLKWNKTQAAKALGIARSTLEEKIKKFGWKEGKNHEA